VSPWKRRLISALYLVLGMILGAIGALWIGIVAGSIFQNHMTQAGLLDTSGMGQGDGIGIAILTLAQGIIAGSILGGMIGFRPRSLVRRHFDNALWTEGLAFLLSTMMMTFLVGITSTPLLWLSSYPQRFKFTLPGLPAVAFLLVLIVPILGGILGRVLDNRFRHIFRYRGR
jgi:hypothetical protein